MCFSSGWCGSCGYVVVDKRVVMNRSSFGVFFVFSVDDEGVREGMGVEESLWFLLGEDGDGDLRCFGWMNS